MNIPTTHDEHYPRVCKAMDATTVRDLLNAQLGRQGLEFRDFGVDYSFYVPGHNFRIVYRGEIVNGTSTQQQILFGRIPVSDDHAERFHKTQRKLEKGRYVRPELGEATYHLPEIGMVLWTFPNDPRLKTLPRLLRADTLSDVFARFEHRRDRQVGAHGYDLARYIPSKRCVLRFHIEWRGPRTARTLPGQAASELETVYGKVYDSPDNTQAAWDTLQDLWRASQRHAGFLRIPQPLHCDPALQALWMARVPGQALTSRAAEVTSDTCARLGVGLALLQQSRIRTQGSHGLERELQSLVENGSAVAHLHPDVEAPVREILHGLERHLPGLPRLPLVASHGTFKLNHIMSEGMSEGAAALRGAPGSGKAAPLSLLDFDSMTVADPMFDVANFTSDLIYLEAQGDLPAGRAALLARAFHEAYFATVPWGRRPRVLDWFVASLLLRKQAYKTVKHLHGDAVPKIGSVMQEALERIRRLDR